MKLCPCQIHKLNTAPWIAVIEFKQLHSLYKILYTHHLFCNHCIYNVETCIVCSISRTHLCLPQQIAVRQSGNKHSDSASSRCSSSLSSWASSEPTSLQCVVSVVTILLGFTLHNPMYSIVFTAHVWYELCTALGSLGYRLSNAFAFSQLKCTFAA